VPAELITSSAHGTVKHFSQILRLIFFDHQPQMLARTSQLASRLLSARAGLGSYLETHAAASLHSLQLSGQPFDAKQDSITRESGIASSGMHTYQGVEARSTRGQAVQGFQVGCTAFGNACARHRWIPSTHRRLYHDALLPGLALPLGLVFKPAMVTVDCCFTAFRSALSLYPGCRPASYIRTQPLLLDFTQQQQQPPTLLPVAAHHQPTPAM
jgi:hypothetical protein